MNSRVSTKLAIVALLTVVILLALLAVGITISSRESYRQEAVNSIAQSYAGPQILLGPVVAEHYKQEVSSSEIDSKGVTTVRKQMSDFRQYDFPKTLTMEGVVVPSERHHGLYRVTVYELRGKLDAEFETQTKADRQYEPATLQFAVSDVRGIVGLPSVTVDGVPVVLRQDQTVTTPSNGNRTVLAAVLPAVAAMESQPAPRRVQEVTGTARRVRVHMDFVLAGTQQLSIAPIGDLNHVLLTSSWASPLFGGRFLPRTRTVDASGFKAEWEISSLASTAQQQSSAGLTGNIDTFDVTLIQPSDPYKLSDRATKYGVLFVLLTFGGFFVFEVMKQLPIHPVQYLLVGFALALFFLLLISLSEHIAFGAAYLVSSAACIGLIGFYLSYVLRSVRRGAIFSGLLAMLFVAIYGLLLSEDNALLLGALLLFAILAAVMVVTRKVDWYGTAAVPSKSLATGQASTASLLKDAPVSPPRPPEL